MALKDKKINKRVKLKLTFAFSMIDMGLIKFYLCLKVQQDRENRIIKLSQLAYINKILKKFYFSKVHAIKTPIKKATLLK